MSFEKALKKSKEIKVEQLTELYRMQLLKLDEQVFDELYKLRIIEGIDESFTAGIPNIPRNPNGMTGD